MANNYFLRTDVLPAEIPALFSNKQLYQNNKISELSIRNSIRSSILQNNQIKNQNQFLQNFCSFGVKNSKPLYFSSKSSAVKTRKMSLLHPAGQVKSLYFIIKYENNITDQMDSNFSFRMPKKRNSNSFSKQAQKLNKAKELLSSFDISSGILSEESIKRFDHYFSYSWVSNFGNMVKNSKFKEIQLKYLYSKKIDLQNFFPSIYTHSLSWALFESKSVAKNARQEKNVFENDIDNLMQEINFKETNGIIVGPELSRIIAELLLVKIDKMVESNLLRDYNKEVNIDFSIIRYVDDIFIFSNSKELNEIIQLAYSKFLGSFNLSLNSSKIQDFNDTQSILYSDVVNLKSIFKNFELVRTLEFSKLKADNKLQTVNKLSDYLGSKYLWTDLFEAVNKTIINSSGRKDNLINYCLIHLRSLVSFSKINEGQILAILNGATLLLKSNFCFKSVRHYIMLLSHIVKQLDKIIKNELSNSDRIIGAENFIVIKNKKILSYVFHHLSNIINTEWFDINEGYEIITFMDFFKSYGYFLSSQRLQSLLKRTELVNDYFILTSITNYIYDSSTKKIFNSYSAVHYTLRSILLSNLYKYSNEGIDASCNGNFFYLLNDFSKFPGHPKLFREVLENEFPTEIQQLSESELSSASYFQWGESFEFFLERVLMKQILDDHGVSSFTSF